MRLFPYIHLQAHPKDVETVTYSAQYICWITDVVVVKFWNVSCCQSSHDFSGTFSSVGKRIVILLEVVVDSFISYSIPRSCYAVSTGKRVRVQKTW